MELRLLNAALAACLILSCSKHGSSGHPVTTPVSQNPEIIDFLPKTGAPGIPVQIWGHHFGDSAGNLQVAFNGTPAAIYTIDDSVMYVYVPAAVTTGKISITRAGLTGVSDSLFTVLNGGHWVQKSGIPGTDSAKGRFVGIGFSVGNKGYMGLGVGTGAYYSDLFQYDPATDTWTQEASAPLALAGAICMVINNIAYVGLGQTQIGYNSNALLAYDPATNSWTRKADYPGSTTVLNLGVAIGGVGLVGLGVDKYGITNPGIYIYDPSSDTWTQKANYGGTPLPSWPIGFSLDNMTALIEGTDSYGDGAFINVLFQYDPASDTWTQAQSRPGSMMVQPSVMVINGNGYILGGGEENWMYQSSTGSWTQIPFFTERVGGASFVIGNTGYFGNGAGISQTALTDLWQFTP
jgi:IPT/TIG domain